MITAAGDPIQEAILRTASEDPEQARLAVEYLLAHPDQSHPALLEAMEQMVGNSSWIAYALGEIGRPESVPILQEKLEVGVHNLRYAAATALAKHPDASAYQALISSLGGKDPAVRGMAARGLGERGDASACGPLEQHLRDPDVEVRVPVIEALAMLGCVDDQRLRELRDADQSPIVHELIDRLLAA